MKYVRVLVAVTLLMLLSLSAIAQVSDGIWVQCRVLQSKLSRLYFDVGEESRVFAGHRAVVIKKKDTVWSGVIAQAYEGVSISEQIAKLPEIKSVTAFVQAAPVDSHAVIRIGTTLSPSLIAVMHSGALDSLQQVTNGLVDSVVVKNYDDAQSMEIDFQSGTLDGIIVYRADGFGDSETRIESAWAPYIAALAPYGSSPLLFQEMVTATLRCRLDTSVARGQFDGTDIRFESCLMPQAPSWEWFACDPKPGHIMLRDLAKLGVPVRIYVPDRELLKVAGYLADLMAREQVKSVLVDTWWEPDLSLAFIPSNHHPEATLRTLLELVGPENTAIHSLPEAIYDLTKMLRNIEETADTVLPVSDWAMAEMTLQNDLHCYPLFRPRIYFVSHNTIRGSIFNADGEIDPAGLMRVQPVVGREK